MLVIALVIVCWIILPLPVAVAVGRSFNAGNRGPVPPSYGPDGVDAAAGGTPDRSGDLAA